MRSLFLCSLLKLTKACVNFIVAPQTPQQLGSNQGQRLAKHQQSLDRARDTMRSNSMSSNGNLSFPKRPRLDRDSWKSRIKQGSIKNDFLNEPKQSELAKHKHGVNTMHTCSQTTTAYFNRKQHVMPSAIIMWSKIGWRAKMKRRSGENAMSHKCRVSGLFCNSLLFHFLFSFFYRFHQL